MERKKGLFNKTLVIVILIMFFATTIIPTVAKVNIKNNSLNEIQQLVFTKNVIEDSSFNFLDLPFKPNSQFNSKNQYEIIENKQPVSNENIYFTNPLNNDVLRAGDIILITGTITDEKFKNYIVEYGQGINPIEWLTTGITLINSGNSPIENDTVATWDTSHITEPDFFTLKITTNLKSKPKIFLLEKSKVILFPLFQQLIATIFQKNMQLKPLANQKTNFIKNIYLDPTLKEGWPQRIIWDKIPWDEQLEGTIWPGLVEPVVSDINNDGDKEIVVYKAGDPTKIYVFNSDGYMVNGWPADVDYELLPGDNIGPPTIADIDNDGYQEIFVNGKEGIYIYNHNGSFLRKIKQINSCEPKYSQECLVYDLDNDGGMEIIKKFISWKSQGGRIGTNLTVFDIYGNVLSGWPQMICDYKGQQTAGGESIPAIGNFDDDSDLEIVVATNRYVDGTSEIKGRIIVYNLNGSILNGFPLDIDERCPSAAPAVGDVNNDGMDEIIAAALQGIYVIDRYGNFCTGWPKLIDTEISASPALADFDNDGFLEIVISKIGYPFETYIFDYQGNILSGWPQQTSWNNYRAPTVGDVNGDNNPDVVATAGNGIVMQNPEEGGVYAWNLDGSLIDGFPKVTDIDAQAAATIADIDGDGKVEIIASSDWDEDLESHKLKNRSSIYVWELGSDFNEETLEWPMFHRDTMHTGYYALDFPVTSSVSYLMEWR